MNHSIAVNAQVRTSIALIVEGKTFDGSPRPKVGHRRIPWIGNQSIPPA